LVRYLIYTIGDLTYQSPLVTMSGKKSLLCWYSRARNIPGSNTRMTALVFLFCFVLFIYGADGTLKKVLELFTA